MFFCFILWFTGLHVFFGIRIKEMDICCFVKVKDFLQLTPCFSVFTSVMQIWNYIQKICIKS